jgi:hypothetical protein
MMVIGAETFTLQSRKAHPAIWVTKHQGAQGPQDFFGVGLLPRAIVSAQPRRSRARDQSLTGRRTDRPASSDMTLSSCGGSCGPRCRQRSGRRDRGCSRGGAIAHLAPPPRPERQLGGWRRPFVTFTSRDRKTPNVGAAWRRGWPPEREPAASLRPYADIPPGVVILNATTGTIRRITLRGGWRLRADRAIGGG